MNILDFVDIILRHRWVVIACTAAAIIVATVGSILMDPVYVAASMIRIPATSNPLESYVNVIYAQNVMNTYEIIGRSQPIMNKIIDELDLDSSSTRLARQINVIAIEDTELLRIEVEDTDPVRATSIANALAQALIDESIIRRAGQQTASDTLLQQMNQVQQELTDLRNEYNRLLAESPGETLRIADVNRLVVVKQQIYETLVAQYDDTRLREALTSNTITLVNPATEPSDPVRPRHSLNVLLGSVFGLAGGIGLSLVLQSVDKKIYTPHQMRSVIDLPMLGSIPRMNPRSLMQMNNRIVDLDPYQREAYRRLRTNIFALAKETPIKTIMVTSADSDEGKSTVVANLGRSLSHIHSRVLIIDCDLRRPDQHTHFDIPNEVGLTSVMEGQIDYEHAIQDTQVEGLRVLTAGPVAAHPTEMLSSPRFQTMLIKLSAQYDMVLVDSPPLIPVIDAAVIAPMVDGVLQVVRSGRSREETTAATLTQILDVQARPLGFVLNDVDSVPTSTYITSPVPPTPSKPVLS